ncbi:MAG: glycolate oxidase iron-sulfur subunit [Gammaproteobacteria bacterium SG8_11]|nr:MAG: glycolate oxidase iron-sulfur subunit [Gammaproteobacteria bacterium SG8_11]
MQTNLAEFIKNTPEGKEADAILRSCVHCGFCTATCPTYQLLGDELDGPRGRIYLIKQLLEGKEISIKTQQHLDRCLTCRSCETTCPSGVKYSRLLDIGRLLTEKTVPRSFLDKMTRNWLRTILPEPKYFRPLLLLGQAVRGIMPGAIRNKIPQRQTAKSWPQNQHQRKMIVLQGCVQSVATPNTNAAVARVLDKLAISLIAIPEAGCCGAVSHHLSAPEQGLNYMRNNIDAWWPHVEAGAEAIVITASGCGAVVKDYGHLLANDPAYASKAQRISELCKDVSEVLAAENFSALQNTGVTEQLKVAFHSPCTLQHGQQINGVVESILQQAGFQLTAVPNAHLCCGSAGTYSILQPEISKRLLHNKLRALQTQKPDVIATANIGCQLHLQSQSPVPIKHWIELLAAAID